MTTSADARLDWCGPQFEGDNRQVGFCGHAAIGAVFAPRSGRYWRWRIWNCCNFNPVEGGAKTEEDAKANVEDRFCRFLELAGLRRAALAAEGKEK